MCGEILSNVCDRIVREIKASSKQYYTEKLKLNKRNLLRTNDIPSQESNLATHLRIALLQEIMYSHHPPLLITFLLIVTPSKSGRSHMRRPTN